MPAFLHTQHSHPCFCFPCPAFAAFLLKLREEAEAREAELNARIQSLESHIHWLEQANQQLKGAQPQAATQLQVGHGNMDRDGVAYRPC
jgi:hypothetical protein